MPYRPLKVYLINMAMGWVQQKKELELDPKYKLPKMRYKGDSGVTPQTMRMDAKPLVTEMRDVPEDPEFPLLTKRRPITVPGPPKASKDPQIAGTAPSPPSNARTSAETPAPSVSNPIPSADRAPKSRQASASSSVLKEASMQPLQAASAAANGSAVPPGTLCNQHTMIELHSCVCS